MFGLTRAIGREIRGIREIREMRDPPVGAGEVRNCFAANRRIRQIPDITLEP